MIKAFSGHFLVSSPNSKGKQSFKKILMGIQVFLILSLSIVLAAGGFRTAGAYDKNAEYEDTDQAAASLWKAYLLINDGIRRRPEPSQGTMLAGNSKIFSLPLYDFSGEMEPVGEKTLLGNDEKSCLAWCNSDSDKSKRDWEGIGRDTGFFLVYQALFAGVLYFMPESISAWTPEQKKDTLQQWRKNVGDPVWDKDKWWINYLAHPYFGATYYIRARERGFDECSSFWYSAMLSAMYEFIIEAFFEKPSLQDLIVTPIGGFVIGKFIFEPLRNSVKAKPELKWYDHLTLILTDPLGAVNSVFEKLFGIKSDIRLQFNPPAFATRVDTDHNASQSLKWREINRFTYQGVGLEFSMALK
jgi:hypothetical protein